MVVGLPGFIKLKVAQVSHKKKHDKQFHEQIAHPNIAGDMNPGPSACFPRHPVIFSADEGVQSPPKHSIYTLED